MLRSFEGNITEINAWMGRSRTAGSTSRMHMDAMDNLYVVIEGSKLFQIVSPSEALHVKTVSPSYAVSPDGLSYQFDANKFRDYMRAREDAGATSSNQLDTNCTSTTHDEAIVDESGQSISISGINRKESVFVQANATAALLQSDVPYSIAHAHFSTHSFLSSEAPIIQSTQFTVRAGEILYLPTGWFHQVTLARGKHVAINYWWRALHWQSAVAFELDKSRSLFKKLSDAWR